MPREVKTWTLVAVVPVASKISFSHSLASRIARAKVRGENSVWIGVLIDLGGMVR